MNGLEAGQFQPWSGAVSGSIDGQVRAVDRRLKNDAGWFPWMGVADLAAIGYVAHGRADEVWHRFDAYQRAGRRVVRVLGMLGAPPWVAAGLDFSPRTPGYADFRDQVVREANKRGMYVHLDLFADAQILATDWATRLAWTQQFAHYCETNPGIIPGLSNEPFKNGWTEADDPQLLALGEAFAEIVGHRDFFIGDPADGTDADSSNATTLCMITVSRHCNFAALHPDRSYGDNKRWRRWIDHLEGMTDVVHQLAPGAAYIITEPIGAGPADIPGRRDSNADAFIAGQFVAACCGFGGFTYHKIDSEIPVENLPGFYEIGALLAQVPCSPEWVYKNDSWPGSPTEGISWRGAEGKMRSLVSGDHAWTVAYGEANFDSVKWRAGWVPTIQYAGERVRVWSVTK